MYIVWSWTGAQQFYIMSLQLAMQPIAVSVICCSTVDCFDVAKLECACDMHSFHNTYSLFGNIGANSRLIIRNSEFNELLGSFRSRFQQKQEEIWLAAIFFLAVGHKSSRTIRSKHTFLLKFNFFSTFSWPSFHLSRTSWTFAMTGSQWHVLPHPPSLLSSRMFLTTRDFVFASMSCRHSACLT